MKRFALLLALFSLTLALMVGVSVTADDTPQTPVQRRAFVDADGDGVCDNYATRPGSGTGNGRGRQGAGFVDADGDGVCDNAVSGYGRGNGQPGSNFVDADGDGVCDNIGTRRGAGNAKANAGTQRTGRGNGSRRGK
jgi:hypothetical protein